MKVLIADKLAEAGIKWLKQQEDVEVDVKPGLAPEELAKIVGQYDGMIIRSGVKVRKPAQVLATWVIFSVVAASMRSATPRRPFRTSRRGGSVSMPRTSAMSAFM